MNYKFRERELIEELQAYVDSTYDQHYATDKYQATDVIIDSGLGTGFCLGNVIKYAKRYGRKGSHKDHRKDLMKVLHYALIQLYIHDDEYAIKADPTKHEIGYPIDTLALKTDPSPDEWDRAHRAKGAPLCG